MRKSNLFEGSWNSEKRLLVPFFAVSGLLLSFAVIANEAMNGRALAFDRYVMFVFRSSSDNFSNPVGPAWVREMARDVTSMGSFSVIGILVAVVVGYLIANRKWEAAVFATSSIFGGVLISSLLKFEFARPRPDLFEPAATVFTASFPSDHAAISAVTYITFASLLKRSVSPATPNFFMVVAITLTVLIGATRVYLGVHYPTDVLAGWCIGAAWAVTCSTIMKRLHAF
jgi:undecaprenyl-diphosphatase